MGQSKQPAHCIVCGVMGPPRSKAAAHGWVRFDGMSNRSSWACPPCAKEKIEKERLIERERLEQLPSQQPKKGKIVGDVLLLAALSGVIRRRY
jgi:hypothetical protein